MRWEDPALGVNGEGRVTPIIPGCQTSLTVIGKDGQDVVRNHLFRPARHRRSGPEGQVGSDMSPVQPHTVGKVRSCESCHGSEKAAGYGIGGGRLNGDWAQGRTVDLQTVNGQIIPTQAQVQIAAMAGLERDWSAVLTPEGKQTQTVGHHFKESGPLSPEQRQKLDRKNACLGCHKDIPDGTLATQALHTIAAATGGIPQDNQAHDRLMNKILNTAAWAQVLGALTVGLAFGGLGTVWITRRRRSRRPPP